MKEIRRRRCRRRPQEEGALDAEDTLSGAARTNGRTPTQWGVAPRSRRPYRSIEMRSLVRTLAAALMAALLLPALASALAPCGMPDCPTVECGAPASEPGHDCCPAADGAVAAPFCERHVEAPATPSRTAKKPAERAVVRIDALDPGASSQADLSRSSKGHPLRALDCLSQSCVLRI